MHKNQAHIHREQMIHASHAATRIRPATYRIKCARSGRVRFQQRCHHIWPGLPLRCMMQRQFSFLLKRRRRATSARHTGRQPGTLERRDFVKNQNKKELKN